MLLTVMFAGCEPSATAAGGARQLADYAGVVGTRIELAQAETPDEVPLLLTIGAESWEARVGESWDEAVAVATWDVTRGDVLTVGDVELLSMPMPDAAEVITWYGTFPEAISVVVKDAPFAGEWSFAPDIGPVVLTIDEVRRECVLYERDVPTDTGD